MLFTRTALRVLTASWSWAHLSLSNTSPKLKHTLLLSLLCFSTSSFFFFPVLMSWLHQPDRPYPGPTSFILLSLPAPLSPIANYVTGKPASQAYPMSDKGIIVLSQLVMFVLFISPGRGREKVGMWWDIIKSFLRRCSWREGSCGEWKRGGDRRTPCMTVCWTVLKLLRLLCLRRTASRLGPHGWTKDSIWF